MDCRKLQWWIKNGRFHRLVLACAYAAFKTATEHVECCDSNVIRYTTYLPSYLGTQCMYPCLTETPFTIGRKGGIEQTRLFQQATRTIHTVPKYLGR